MGLTEQDEETKAKARESYGELIYKGFCTS